MENYNKYSLKFIIIFSILCVMLKLLLSILFPYATLILICIRYIYLIYIVYFCIRFKKYFFIKKIYIHMLIFIVAFVFSGLPIDKQIELSRFYILDNYYTAIAEQVITELQSKENTMNGEYELKFPQQFITMNNERILYIKQDLDIIISFRVTKSFFARYDFVYFSSPEARQLIEGNNKYDSFEWLDSPYWGYVKWY